MISTSEVFNNNRPISPMTSSPVKKPSAQKSLFMLTTILYVSKKKLTVELDLLNLSARRFNMERHHGNLKKEKRALKNQ